LPVGRYSRDVPEVEGGDEEAGLVDGERPGLILITDKEEGAQFFFPDDALDIVSFPESFVAVDIEYLVSGAE
jgi:hypothetical protein